MRFRSVDLVDLGLWEPLRRSSIRFKTHISRVSLIGLRVRFMELMTLAFPAIQLSDHFVYIENQFFITSTVVDGVEIKNRIGDALVDRIIRAHQEGTPWRACIMIPLLPGYTFPIDTAEASSVRLILECQNRTISRGAQSIFSRLKKQGIDVSD